ncbi:PrgI family protein [Patescibacteria group bacterium]|nr:PrgI family protein [Patescibacteria group bacterium]
MEYQVPQFIEVEDKIIGPLTLRQFIYIAGAAGLCVVFFVYFQFFIAFILSAPVVALAVALAFYKINGKPFIEILEAGFSYYTRAKLFLWKHQDQKIPAKSPAAAASPVPRNTPKLTRGKLSELAWSLDVKPLGGDLAHRES